ncbi:LysR family transcriptional regulator [Mesorhizobium sp. 1B3]|uniref:LysR family transcriptional regulator n=1 Tax=Mesorhizobium sp. 1B3 TaxID=3243599 RepID=UPI003D97F9FF
MARFLTSSYDVRHLRTFLAVVEHGGLSSAAYRLGVSLSSVSRDLTAFETRLGLELCRRGRSGFSLTPQGEDVYQAAVGLRSALQSFEETVENTRQFLGGTLMLGTIDSVITNPNAGIVGALARMHRMFPDMQVSVSMHTVSIIDMYVRDSKLDVGITGQPEGLEQLVYEPAFVETHQLYIARHSPYFDLALEIDDKPQGHGQTRVPYIARDYRTDIFRPFEREYPLQVVARGSTLESILASVLAGIGCSLLPSHLVQSAGDAQLVEIKTRHTPIEVQFHFAYRRDAAKRRAIRAMLDCFRQR